MSKNIIRLLSVFVLIGVMFSMIACSSSTETPDVTTTTAAATTTTKAAVTTTAGPSDNDSGCDNYPSRRSQSLCRIL